MNINIITVLRHTHTLNFDSKTVTTVPSILSKYITKNRLIKPNVIYLFWNRFIKRCWKVGFTERLEVISGHYLVQSSVERIVYITTTNWNISRPRLKEIRCEGTNMKWTEREDNWISMDGKKLWAQINGSNRTKYSMPVCDLSSEYQVLKTAKTDHLKEPFQIHWDLWWEL